MDSHYDAQELWGAGGEQLVLWHSALRCHRDFPLGCGFLALAAACSNGACCQAFGESPSPLFVWVINSNFPQTRKSELCKLLSSGGAELGRLLREHFLAKWLSARDDAVARREAGADEAEEPTLQSVEIPNATAVELFHRLSADWGMVRNFDASMLKGFKVLARNDRLWMSMLINDDEFYNKVPTMDRKQ